MLSDSSHMWFHTASEPQRHLSVTSLDAHLLGSACSVCLTCSLPMSKWRVQALLSTYRYILLMAWRMKLSVGEWSEGALLGRGHLLCIKYFTVPCLSTHLRECHICFLEIYPVVLKGESLFPKPVSVCSNWNRWSTFITNIIMYHPSVQQCNFLILIHINKYCSLIRRIAKSRFCSQLHQESSCLKINLDLCFCNMVQNQCPYMQNRFPATQKRDSNS